MNTTFLPVTAFDGPGLRVGVGQCLGEMTDVFARKVDLFYNIDNRLRNLFDLHLLFEEESTVTSVEHPFRLTAA